MPTPGRGHRDETAKLRCADGSTGALRRRSGGTCRSRMCARPRHPVRRWVASLADGGGGGQVPSCASSSYRSGKRTLTTGWARDSPWRSGSTGPTRRTRVGPSGRPRRRSSAHDDLIGRCVGQRGMAVREAVDGHARDAPDGCKRSPCAHGLGSISSSPRPLERRGDHRARRGPSGGPRDAAGILCWPFSPSEAGSWCRLSLSSGSSALLVIWRGPTDQVGNRGPQSAEFSLMNTCAALSYSGAARRGELTRPVPGFVPHGQPVAPALGSWA